MLEREGWYLDRHGSSHDIYRHPRVQGIITLPRHPVLSIGMDPQYRYKSGLGGVGGTP